jgi:gluconolactonase
VNPQFTGDDFEVFATNIDHSECIAFDRSGMLWAGGEAGQIYRIAKDGKAELVTNMGGFCGGLAFSPADELYVCNPAHGIVRVRPGGEYEVFASHAGPHKLVCPNYGVFDIAGNYYVTDSGQFRKRNGYLIRYDLQGNGEIVAGPFGYANGLALSEDEKTLFMVESDTDSVLQIDLCATGKVAGHRVFATGCGRFPDGLTLDAAGNLYVCCYASDEIWKIANDGTKTLFAWDRWAIRLGSPTNMAFGGAGFDELYVANLARTTVTRARIGVKGQMLTNQRTA